MNYPLIFKSLRKKLKLTQDEFATKTGINRGTISQIEIGTQKPTVDQLAIIVNIFNIDGNIFLKESVNNDYISTPIVSEERIMGYGSLKHVKNQSESSVECNLCIEKDKRIAMMNKLLDEKERLITVLLNQKKQ